ncbi:acyltransferase family protein [Actinomadura flavalba]|uniref:acyltransferase family protein n=1 Tax=Actinomadura flavalba TaxID=1120938 RepID=UPI00039BCA6A|nr:acyltransferase [Actinomadura flavalba]
MDALRFFAILGVVLGHWCVTALTTVDGTLRSAGPLAAMPHLAPLTWVFQTLAVFFLAGGYGAARGYRPGTPWREFASARLARLARPVPALLLAWTPALLVLAWAGQPYGSLRTIAKLVVSPLWFLAVYAVLVALTPLVVRAWRRFGLWTVAACVAATAVLDVAAPSQASWGTLLTGWLVPFTLGVAWACGGLDGRRVPAVLLVGGTVATAALLITGAYPASMVGVPGEAVSNLNPPTLAAVTFGLAQTGLALLLRGPLTRWTRRPRVWATVALANLTAITIFLWHQTALLTVTLLTLPIFGPLPGLHTPPTDATWITARALCLPAFALTLLLFLTTSHHATNRTNKAQAN